MSPEQGLYFHLTIRLKIKTNKITTTEQPNIPAANIPIPIPYHALIVIATKILAN
ncbi:hypothetical protein [Gracilibacillus saliphilus]|uniref:hypothetical protein n=1 Tax=Gracilibacillus saliphilus TaxID=543890 RepID=UPI0013D4EB4F|nr:hypothetical protein [Gracilibacillus saliphilus]